MICLHMLTKEVIIYFQCGIDMLFVDFGNEETAYPSTMYWLCEHLASYPVQAVYCSLCGVKPLTVCILCKTLLCGVKPLTVCILCKTLLWGVKPLTVCILCKTLLCGV